MGIMMNTLGMGSGRARGENTSADELEDSLQCSASASTLRNVDFIIKSYEQFNFPEPGDKNWEKHIKNTRKYFKVASRSEFTFRTAQERSKALVEILHKKIKEKL